MPGQSIQIEMMDEGLAQSETDLGATIIWNGTEYPCTAGPIFGGKHVDEGGWRTQSRCLIKVRTVNFPEGVQKPEEKKLLQFIRGPGFDPITFRIESLNDYFGHVLELACEDPNRGA